MSHRDTHVRLNCVCLRQCFRWLLAGVGWSGVSFRADCRWTPRTLTIAALLWAWSDELTLGERFRTARKITSRISNPQRQLAVSYQAFMKILQRWTCDLRQQLTAVIRARMYQALPQHWQISGWLMFGVDGSRIELPRTQSHEQAYSTVRHHRRGKNRYGRRLAAKDVQKANSPQLWLTTMWHAGTGLPWNWRIGPADSSERAHLQEMLPDLPARALVAADAGFVGYVGMHEILTAGHELLIRVGSNVRLLKQLGWARESAGTVYLWPAQRSQQNQPPLTLRLVVAHNGKHPVYLVTSVLSQHSLSDREVVALYAKRWGIELFYRHLKQTFQRRKLFSTSAINARIEIEWSLLGLWAMALYALVETTQQKISPERLSFAQLLLAFRRTLRDYLHPTERKQRLCERLRGAIVDSYVRKNKASRNHPQKKKEQAAGPPILLKATLWQRKRAQQVKKLLSIRLTA